MKTKSIRYYFFTSIATVLVISTLVMGLVQILLATGYFREEKEALLAQVAQAVADAARDGQIGIQSETIQTVRYMAGITGATVIVTDPHGRVQYSTGSPEIARGTMLAQDILEKLYAQGSYNEMGRLGDMYPSNHYNRSATLYSGDGTLIGFVFASSDAALLQVYLTDLISAFLVSALLVLLVSSILALFLTNRTLAPIRRVSQAAQHFAEGDYSARVPVEGDDELAQLAITFNEMANSFQSTDVSRRSFMGNIAHELRTPMTTIKGFIDGMLDGTIPEDQRDKYLGVVSDEVGRLARLTKNMLDISRLEAGEYTANNVVFDIWAPIATVMLGAEQRLNEKDLTVKGLEETKPGMVLADEDFVYQILYNLVDNAIKFADDDGTISVSVATTRTVVTTSVRNTGAGIPPDLLSHIFDRFYKADKSRGMNARGAGLGLHISKVLVGLMGGRIWATSEEGQWSEFHFSLPAAPPQKRGGRQ